VLYNNTTGNYNTAIGDFALANNITGGTNTAIGAYALFDNTVDGNTAVGFNALASNTIGPANTANGAFALVNNTEGALNTGTGVGALQSNTMGNNNTGTGVGALQSTNIGVANTANGTYALAANTTGSFNTADGASALPNNTIGNNNTALGVNAGTGVTTATNVICIGVNIAGANVDNSCYIGNIFGQPIDPATAIAVGVDASGKLGTTVSSRRFKHDIKAMDRASEALLALKPVTFHYKDDAKGTPQFGLIAEEVAEVNPDLVVRAKNGEILTVHYDAVNAMLLNEFLKEHRKVEQQDHRIQEQDATIAQLRKEMETFVGRLKEHDSEIQRVNDQLQMSIPAPQVVATDH